VPRVGVCRLVVKYRRWCRSSGSFRTSSDYPSVKGNFGRSYLSPGNDSPHFFPPLFSFVLSQRMGPVIHSVVVKFEAGPAIFATSLCVAQFHWLVKISRFFIRRCSPHMEIISMLEFTSSAHGILPPLGQSPPTFPYKTLSFATVPNRHFVGFFNFFNVLDLPRDLALSPKTFFLALSGSISQFGLVMLYSCMFFFGAETSGPAFNSLKQLPCHVQD